MTDTHELTAQVYAAKEDNGAADALVRQYLPFIKAQTAKFIKRIPSETDDEVSVAMFAFHEAVMAYSGAKGAFISFAARAIKNRLIDFARREKRHKSSLSLDSAIGSEDNRALIEKTDTGRDEIAERTHASAAKSEIAEFSAVLAEYGLTLADIADNCPKQERTFSACRRALEYAKAHKELFDMLSSTKKLPMARLSYGAGIERKTLERHRKYMVAIMLAYTNGFEIIRGHISQIAPEKGGETA